MEPSSTHASLLSRVRDPADDAAWREFADRYGDLILRYFRSRGLQHTDAEDLRQGVLMALARAMREGGFRYSPDKGRFRDYLGTTARHAAGRFLARHTRRPGVLSMDEMAQAPADGDDGPDALWEREWVDHHYRSAMETIRGMFDARSIDAFERLAAGMPGEAVAREVGMTHDAVRAAKHRIVARLREVIAWQVQEEDHPDG